MHPAPSVIVFTVLSGMGFGYLAFLGAGIVEPSGLDAFFLFALGYGLAVIGLLASTFHLGNPQRAWRAFTQWRTSWLSREGWTSVLTLIVLAPVALSAMFLDFYPVSLGAMGAALAVLTVFCTSMIYAQLKTVPRWNHWTTPVMFLAFAATGGAMLSGLAGLATIFCVILAIVMILAWMQGDGRFAARGSTMESATGLGAIGKVRLFEGPHTNTNYLMKEMIHHVGRKHAVRLRQISVLFAAVIPAVLLIIWPLSGPVQALAIASHLLGALTSRWLFFAEAEHVVGLYYGQR